MEWNNGTSLKLQTNSSSLHLSYQKEMLHEHVLASCGRWWIEVNQYFMLYLCWMLVWFDVDVDGFRGLGRSSQAKCLFVPVRLFRLPANAFCAQSTNKRNPWADASRMGFSFGLSTDFWPKIDCLPILDVPKNDISLCSFFLYGLCNRTRSLDAGMDTVELKKLKVKTVMRTLFRLGRPAVYGWWTCPRTKKKKSEKHSVM